jgi:hypothetical protein
MRVSAWLRRWSGPCGSALGCCLLLYGSVGSDATPVPAPAESALRNTGPQGAVCLWTFDNSLQDHSGQIHDALTACEGQARFVDGSEVPGTVGKAVALGVRPGDAEFLTAPPSADLELGPNYTIEAWIQPTALATWNRLVLRWGQAPNYAWHVALHNGAASLFHNQAGGQYRFAEGGQVEIGRWHHLAAVASRHEADPGQSTLTVFLDGRLVGQESFDGTIKPLDREALGMGDSSGAPGKEARFRGYVDELTIWNQALPAEEIAAHYSKRAGMLRELEQAIRRQEAARRKEQLARLGVGPFPEIVFAERNPGRDPSQHYYANFGYACTSEQEWLHGADGARLCRLDPNTGELTVLLADPKGGIRDPQVSYDGRKILFSYRKGGTHHYNLHEINADGAGLRRITSGDWDDVEPCYLPDGGIAFCSSRCKRYVLCWLAPVAILFRCNPDGTGLRMLSSGSVTENTPSVLPDGRILYTRWEYVNRDAVSFHHLWTMNPDGTEQQVYYGNQTPGEVFIDAQPIPQTREVVFIDSGYHGSSEHAGKVMIVSQVGGPNTTATLKCLSPGGSGYRDPYPVSPQLFLVAHGNRVLALDEAGQTTELYRGPQMVQEPRPLRPRPLERAVSSRVDLSANTATLFVADVYQGRKMQGVKRGDIRKLLVLEDLPKPVNYHGGGTTPLAHGGTWTLKRILGTVPVAEDGSAYLEVPPLRSLYLALLDAQDRSVKQMRSFVTLQPGEQRGCIGCHETRTQPPPSQRTLAALRRAPSRIEPIAGVPETLDFPRDIQPVLDRQCVTCHNADKRAGGVVLTGDRGPTYSLAYYNLILHQQIKDGAGYGWANTQNVEGRPIGNDAPNTTYSSASPIMDKIGGQHHDVKLNEAERTLVRLWIDTAAQYAGTYAAYGTGQIGAWWRNNEPIREMADLWPTTAPAKQAVEQRCTGCHGRMLPRFVTDPVPVDAYGDFEGWQRPTSRFSRHTIFNLTRPEKSLTLMAPLAREAGGYAAGAPQPPKPITEDRANPPQPVTHPVVFTSAADPDYQKILAHLQAARARLDEIKRFDMAGFQPRAEYVRDMIRYGVLPAGCDPTRNPIDVYATDQAYWKSLWHRPSQP